jgi:hypothetical protein
MKTIADYPELLPLWHPTKNNDLIVGGNKKVWWKCLIADDHEWDATIGNMCVSIKASSRGCPYCSGDKIALSNCLATTHPEIAAQWHPTKNGDLTPYDVGFGGHIKVWWKCLVADDHEWETSPNRRTDQKGGGCPCCRGLKTVNSNCLATTHPQIAVQWHPTKNGEITPYMVVSGSARKFWWKCLVADDHEWEASVEKRTAGRECPYCSGKKVALSNCLATTHPAIATQWHPTKNGNLIPRMVVSGSGRKVWWKCAVCDKAVKWISGSNFVWGDFSTFQGTVNYFTLIKK